MSEYTVEQNENHSLVTLKGDGRPAEGFYADPWERDLLVKKLSEKDRVDNYKWGVSVKERQKVGKGSAFRFVLPIISRTRHLLKERPLQKTN